MKKYIEFGNRPYESNDSLSLLDLMPDNMLKYIDYLEELIASPDYAGIHSGNIELVKCFKDNIFISIKLDIKKSKYYIATVFDVKQSKIDSYVRSGRLIKIDAEKNM